MIFDKLFDLLYSTNENNRVKGFKNYSTLVLDAKDKLADKISPFNCYFNGHVDLSLLNIIKNDIYLKANFYYPFIIGNEITYCLYKSIDYEDINEAEKESDDVPQEYKGDFVGILLLRDISNIFEVISNFGYEPPFPKKFDFNYEKDLIA